MSWEASIEHYRIINEVTRERLVGLSALRWESAWSITAKNANASQGYALVGREHFALFRVFRVVRGSS